MRSPRVVHCKREPFDVYIGRPSKWGNPFKLRHEDDRPAVLEQYRAWLMKQPALIEAAKRELRGKVLGCWCAPKACHGDVLAEIANAQEGAPMRSADDARRDPRPGERWLYDEDGAEAIVEIVAYRDTGPEIYGRLRCIKSSRGGLFGEIPVGSEWDIYKLKGLGDGVWHLSPLAQEGGEG